MSISACRIGERLAVAGSAVALTLSLVGAAAAAPAPPTPGACDPATPTAVSEPNPALQRLQAAEANKLATGRGVLVAVVDSGVNEYNPHLRGVVLPGKSFLVGDPSKGREDRFGHGTAIAGLIAARPVPGSSVVGLAPEARILPVKVYDSPQATNGARPEDVLRVDRIAAGIRWAADQKARIINVSLSAPTDRRMKAAVKYARKKGALVLASVGNRQDQNAPENTKTIPDGPRYPAGYKGVIGVTAADTETNKVTSASVHGSHVDVAAPGTRMHVPYFGGDCILAPVVPSTSFATAYATATAALLKQRFPKATAAEISLRLTKTASNAKARNRVSGFGTIRPVPALTATARDLK